MAMQREKELANLGWSQAARAPLELQLVLRSCRLEEVNCAPREVALQRQGMWLGAWGTKVTCSKSGIKHRLA